MALPLSALALAIALAPSVLPAQAVPPPGDPLAALSLRAGTFQNLPAPRDARRPHSIQLTLGGAQRTLDLTPYDLRARGYRLLLSDGTGLRPVDAPPPLTWRGVVRGRVRSVVAASVHEGRWTAMIRDGERVWHVQPAPGTERARHVVYRETDVVIPEPVRCSVPNAPATLQRGSSMGRGGVAANPTHELELALDADLEFFQLHGSSVSQTQAAIMQNVNAVDAIYQNDVGVRHVVTKIIVRASRVYQQTNMGQLLNEFQNHWNSNHSNIVRDLAHLYTGKGSFSGVVGIANLNSLCWGSMAYCVSKAISGNAAMNTAVVAHEMAHTWGVQHCDSAPPCNIMCSTIGGCYQNITSFGSQTRFVINLQLATNQRSCVRKLVTALYTYSGTGCTGSNGVPELQASGRPVIGTLLHVSITGAGAGLPAAIYLGVSNTTWLGAPLPFDLGPHGAPGCFVRASGEYSQPCVTNASGTCSVPYAVPNDTGVVGTQLYNQGFVYEPVNPLGVAVTGLGTALLGDF